MLFHVCYDEFSYIYQPHGTEPEFWSTTLEGSEMLKAGGWRPFEMHRVSRHLHLALLSGGHLEAPCGGACGDACGGACGGFSMYEALRTLETLGDLTKGSKESKGQEVKRSRGQELFGGITQPQKTKNNFGSQIWKGPGFQIQTHS